MDESKIYNQIKKQEVFSSELRKAIKDFYIDAYKDKNAPDHFNDAFIEKKVMSEESFFTKVIEALLKAKKENLDKEIVSLFDLDETLVVLKIKEDGFETIIRPSALALLEHLKKEGITSGFFTSRADLENQLQHKLKPMDSFIDRKYLFSTRGLFVPMEKEHEIKEAHQDRSMAIGDIEKTHFLNELNSKEIYKKSVFVPVDDLEYPTLFPYGVALRDEEKFFI